MISAAVIEDNKDFAEMLREKIISEPKWSRGISVAVYYSPEDFLEDISISETEGGHEKEREEKKGQEKRFDVAFLDVEMPGISGMELAERIRTGNREMLLVFVSSFSEYALEGYQVYAFDYLLKSQLERRWDRLVDRLREALTDSREKWYTVQTRNRTERVFIEDIVYLCKEEKYVVIVTEKERFAVRKTMQEAAKDFVNYRQFIPVKRGILINMDKVQRATARELLMSNGEYITVGRMYVERVREQMHAYLRNKG